MKKNTDLQKMGNYIKELRESKKLSQKDLADKLQLDNKTISKWERGTSAVDITYLVRLADVLNTTPEELLVGSKISNKSMKNSPLISYIKKEKRKLLLTIIIIFLISIVSSCLIINKIKKDNKTEYYDIQTQGNFQLEGYVINNNSKSFLIINKIVDEEELTDYIYKVHIIINGKENTKYTYEEKQKYSIQNFNCAIIVQEKIDFSKDLGLVLEYYKDGELKFDSVKITK